MESHKLVEGWVVEQVDQQQIILHMFIAVEHELKRVSDCALQELFHLPIYRPDEHVQLVKNEVFGNIITRLFDCHSQAQAK